MYKLDHPETCNLSLGKEMAQRLLLRLLDMNAELRSGNMGFTYKDFPAISETPQPPPTTHKSWSISSFLLEAGGRRSGGATSMRGTWVLRASVGPKTDEWANEGKVIKTLYIDQQAPNFRGTA